MSRRNLTHTFVTLASVGFLLATSAATAAPPHTRNHGSEQRYRGGDGHAQPRGQACRTVYTFGRRGKGKILVCDGPASRHAASPPWAPAYGHREQYREYRQKHDDRRRVYWHGNAPWHPIAYPRARAGNACNSTLLTGVGGGVSGAILGSRVGNGSGRTVATAAGTLIGALAGLGIGESLDRACLRQALEQAPDGGTVTWNDGRVGARPWQTTPTATWEAEDGRYCREFTSTATVGGQTQQIYGRACRQPDGSWEVVS